MPNYLETPGSRRTFFKLSTTKAAEAAGVASLTAALLIQKEAISQMPEPRTFYNGKLAFLEGKPLITDREFGRLTGELIKSGNPFLSKIGRDIHFLHYAQTRPVNMPDWVGFNSFPLPITYRSDDNDHVYAVFAKEGNPDTSFALSDRPDVLGEDLKELTIGTDLNTPSHVRRYGPLAESLLLAKEHITHMFSIKTAQEYHLFLQRVLNKRLVDSSGVEITDPKRLERIGANLFYSASLNKTSAEWRVTDAVPTLLLGMAVSDLAKRRKLPSNVANTSLALLYLAENQVSANPELLSRLSRIQSYWMQGQGFLPMGGFIFDVLNEVMAKEAYKFQDLTQSLVEQFKATQ